MLLQDTLQTGRLHCSRRIYQYHEEDFGFQFGFLPSFQTAWRHINVETKKSDQLTASLGLLVNLLFE